MAYSKTFSKTFWLRGPFILGKMHSRHAWGTIFSFSSMFPSASMSSAAARGQMKHLSSGGTFVRSCGIFGVTAAAAALFSTSIRDTHAAAEAREGSAIIINNDSQEEKAQDFNIVRRVDNPNHTPDLQPRVKPSNLTELVRAAADSDVVFFGEVHDDAEAHRLELWLFKQLHIMHSHTRQIFLSLEMFETDVQDVIDEYMLGLIRESDFVTDARAWKNYEDYRALIEYAKHHHIPVIAANAPRRYVAAVGKRGSSALSSLPPSSHSHLPPLPLAPASAGYQAKFHSMMESLHSPPPPSNQPADTAAATQDAATTVPGAAATPDPADPAARADPAEKSCPYIGFSAKRSGLMLEAQNVWDATMAHSIAKTLERRYAPNLEKKPLVLHVCGKFHCENHLGIPEHLCRYAPDLEVLIAVCAGEDELSRMREAQVSAMAHFVAISAPALPSFQVTHPV